MNLNEFNKMISGNVERIDNQDRVKISGTECGSEKIPVVIMLSEPSMGPSAKSEVTGAYLGFDWDAGNFFIMPKEKLVRQSFKDAEAKIVKRSAFICCSSCGVQVKEHDFYCRKCGKRFENSLEITL